MIELRVNGQPYTGFTSLNYSRSMENLTGQFSFVATNADNTEFPIKAGDECAILVNDTPIITGFIDALSPSLSTSSNLVNIQGRDKTADFVDSTLNAGSVELVAPISLKEVIEKTVASLGQSLKVINNVSGLEDFTAEDLISAEAGQNAFDFVEKFARKRQVLLTTNGIGDIVITRSSDEIIDYEIVNRFGGDENNVKTSSIAYNNSRRYNQYIMVSQANLTSLNNFGIADLDQVVDSKNDPVIDSEIREGRVLHLVAEKSSSPEQNRLRATWEANFRKAQSQKYNSTTDDFALPRTNEPFPVNALVPVVDDSAGITAIMLIESVGLSLDSSGGTETSFGIVPRNAYSLKLEEPVNEKKANAIGFNFT